MTWEQRAELSSMAGDRRVDAVVAGRARMVLWRDEGRSAEEVAVLAGVSRPTGEHLGAPPLPRPRGAGPGRPAPTRQAGRGVRAGTGTDSGVDSDDTTRGDRPDALVEPGDGHLPGPTREHPGVAHLHRRPVACPRAASPPVGHLQAVPRSGVRRQGRRHRWPVPEPARRGCVDEKTQVRWTARSRCCRSTSTVPRHAPTTTSGTVRRTCSPPSTPPPAGSPPAASRNDVDRSS